MSCTDPRRRYVLAIDPPTGDVLSYSFALDPRDAERIAARLDAHNGSGPHRYLVRIVPVLAGAELRHDPETGEQRTDWARCGTCGRYWNDADVSTWTPAPAARCPFEYEHDDDTD